MGRRALTPAEKQERMELKESQRDGSNTKALTAVIAVQEIAKGADRKNVESLYMCLNDFIRYCAESNMAVTNALAYGACGLTKKDVDDILAGKLYKKDQRYADFARHIRSVCAQYREALMVSGSINPVLGIWWQKSYDHMIEYDQKTVASEEKATAEEAVDAAELARKYKGNIQA